MNNFILKKSQAMVEMAILGPLVLMTLGMLVSYVVKVNNDSYALMQSFRYALAKSHMENKAISYGTWHDPPAADASNPIIGKKVTSSGAGYVMWAIPSVEDQGQDAQTGMWIKINSGFETDISQQESGAVEPRYFTTSSSTVTANTNDGVVSTSRSGHSEEAMIYKVDNQIIPGFRVHGR